MKNRRLDYLLIQTRIKMILQKVTKKNMFIYLTKKNYISLYTRKKIHKNDIINLLTKF